MRSTPRALAARTFSVRNIRLPYVDGIFEKSENYADDRRSMETPDEDIVCSRNPECPEANVSAKTREIDFRGPLLYGHGNVFPFNDNRFLVKYI